MKLIQRFFFSLLFAEKRYPTLCEACYNPSTCSKTDKYWGRMGPLYCLTSGDGEVAWVRKDDVRAYFGVSEWRKKT